jgi:hypothetical protein
MGTDPVLSVVRRPAGQVSGWAPPCWVSTRRDMTRRVLPFSYAGASPRSAGWRCHGRCPQSYGDHFGSGDSFSDLVLGLAPEAHFLTPAHGWAPPFPSLGQAKAHATRNLPPESSLAVATGAPPLTASGPAARAAAQALAKRATATATLRAYAPARPVELG